VEVTIKTKTATAKTINQRYLVTNGFSHKFNALCKVMESETFDGMLIFVRTKIQTVELAEKLARLGYGCAPLNGDIQQNQRTRTVEQLKSGGLDILVATDVAARGLDVDRISHVINFDIPFDNEAYIHRIGRTGRAGRNGEAILFINPQEQAMLRSIERLTKQKIQKMALPSVESINVKRVAKFKDTITAALDKDISFYEELINSYLQENEIAPEKVAAALARIVQGDTPHLLKEPKKEIHQIKPGRTKTGRAKTGRVASHIQLPPEEGMERYRVLVGKNHGIKPGNIVGAIANEADISSNHIGRISIFDSHSTVDLPINMPDDIFRLLQKVWVNNRPLKIQKTDGSENSSSSSSGRKNKHQSPQKNSQLKRSKKIQSKGRQKNRFSAQPAM
jgi:ATP-dependent RNA helicase DeaD